ncbi:PREDICTED: uncharacterized protein LOC105450694 [Wasmannia auropunctata]|uniref:uncharacterized protein LOC105450694 n=1 Tax=Wasmannia auropunctata TaxID=64793 RepID=UPI0005ED75F9|nr:PREDICTED: uncharacterized protein LOC105450694 [Wasmannia auropunctata]
MESSVSEMKNEIKFHMKLIEKQIKVLMDKEDELFMTASGLQDNIPYLFQSRDVSNPQLGDNVLKMERTIKKLKAEVYDMKQLLEVLPMELQLIDTSLVGLKKAFLEIPQ